MPRLNRIQIIGYLGKDPDTRYLPTGKPVTNFTVAVNEDYQRDGETVEQTEWFNVEAWNGIGLNAAQYLRRGSQVYVEGRLRTRDYTDREGVERTWVYILARDIQYLGKPADNQTESSEPNDIDIPF